MESVDHKLSYLQLSPRFTKQSPKLKVEISSKINASKKKQKFVIESTHDTDDFSDIKEILSLISPRELSKPHHTETKKALLHEALSMNYGKKDPQNSNDVSKCDTPETIYQKSKDFIIRKNVPIRVKNFQSKK